MREPRVVFYIGNKEICSYTVRGTFCGELRETIRLLAYENNCDESEIRYRIVNRTA